MEKTMRTPLFPQATKIFITSGSGIAAWPLNLLAFDRALRKAGIADYNHLRVSSIVPPGTEIVEGSPVYPLGSLVPTVYSRAQGEEGIISACIALAIPKDKRDNGVIFEVAGEFTKDVAEERAHSMASLAMGDRNIRIDTIRCFSIQLTIPEGHAGCVLVAAVME